MSQDSLAEPEGAAQGTTRPTNEPSAAVRMTQHIREAITDLGGLVLAGYLVSRSAVSGTHALLFALALLLPSPVLLRLAKIIGARGSSAGAGAAIALLSASALYSKIKAGTVAAVMLAGIAACSSGCSANSAQLVAITPRIVHREDYGTCIESGGKLEVASGPTFALLTQACMLMDAGHTPADADASASGDDDYTPGKDGG